MANKKMERLKWVPWSRRKMGKQTHGFLVWFTNKITKSTRDVGGGIGRSEAAVNCFSKRPKCSASSGR